MEPADPAIDEAVRLKRQLRRRVREGVATLPPEVRRREEAALLDHLMGLPGFSTARSVLLYMPAFAEEVDLRPLLGQVVGSGQVLVLPRVIPATFELVLHRIDDLARDLESGVLGIPEPRPGTPELAPDQVDWALVPGLGFTTSCDRLGRGAGCYDRLLARLPAVTPRWALALSPQWIEALPVQPHDQPLDGVLGADRVARRADLA